MPYIKTKALIIGKKLHKEHDKNLSLLLEDGRRIEAKIRKARDTTAKWGSVTEPVSNVEVDIYDRAGKYTITGIENIKYYSQASYSLMVAQEFVCEAIEKTTAYAHPEDGLFDTALSALDAIENGKARIAVVWFLLELLQIHGYPVHVHSCLFCGAKIDSDCHFDVSTGSTVCKSCRTANCISFPMSAVKAVIELENNGLKAELPEKMARGLTKLMTRILSARFDANLATSLHVQNI
jgi:DNA repair protein RecO